MILGLDELKFIFNPVTRLCYSEFEARLTGLMWSLKKTSLKELLKEKVDFIIFTPVLQMGGQHFSLFEGNIMCAGTRDVVLIHTSRG